MGVRVGEGMHQAACSARSAARLVALLLIETDAMRRVQAPIRAYAYATSSPPDLAAEEGDERHGELERVREGIQDHGRDADS